MEEEDEIQEQPSKLPRVENGRSSSTFQTSSWHNNSSRIVRVSRASGGKDRHSKVMTSKGLRDRRVRLSVNTAIQFYDLQDRLGLDQPSKAVEWLIKAAQDPISELPSLNHPFPETPNQLSDHENQNQNQNQNLNSTTSLSKSACSSNSETSKGSGGLSLSRCENRVKARERARERAAKEKENESSIAHHHHHNHNQISQTASFTELLTGAIGSTVNNVNVPTTTRTSPSGPVHQTHGGHQWNSTVTPMDYFNTGLLIGQHSSSRSSSSCSSIQLGHSHSVPVSPFSGENQSDQMQQHFSFMPEQQHLMVTSSSCSTQLSGISDYNLNFTISSGLAAAGYNRGTLQSNSQSLLPHHHHHHHQLQTFSSAPVDGSSNNINLPFFMGGAAAAAAAQASAPPTMENHHHLQFSPVFNAGLQLRYRDGSRHSDQKGKGKN